MALEMKFLIILVSLFLVYLALKPLFYYVKYKINPFAFIKSRDPIENIAWIILNLLYISYIMGVFFLPTPTHHSFIQLSGLFYIIVGAMLVVLTHHQMGRRWRMGTVTKKEVTLISNGFFRLSRNPVYTGMLIMAFGGVLLFMDLFFLLLFIALLINFYIIIRQEERFLLKKIGSRYLSYKKRVPRFL